MSKQEPQWLLVKTNKPYVSLDDADTEETKSNLVISGK